MRYWLAVALVCSLLLAALPAVAGITPTPGSHSLVINQFYVNGNNSATVSPYAIDYIEIFNAGPVAVDLQNWTIQYQSGTSTANFGGSGIYPIGSLDPYKSGSAWGPNGNGTYPAFQLTYSPAAQAALHCRAAQAGEYTQHCFLQPGQYLLVQVLPNGTAGNRGFAFPLTPDLDLSAGPNVGSIAPKSTDGTGGWIGGTGANVGTALKPSPTAGKLLLSNGSAGNPACSPASASGGNPTPNTSLFGGYSDFVGYYSAGNSSYCWEGPNSTQQLVYANPSPNGPAYIGGTTGTDNKNKLANVRIATYDGTFPPTASIAPCSDSDSNLVDFGRMVIGPPAGSGATNWVLHNSSQSYDVTNGVRTFSANPCAKVANSATPLVSGLNAVASPVEVVANTATPVSLTVTPGDGGVSPTSAVFGVTADLSGVQGLVETTVGSTPQVFGYSAQDTFGNPQYLFPAPASTTTMTVNAPLADVGKTYSIPITVVDDAYRTVTTSISLKVVGNTPGTASLSAVPASVPAALATDVDLTAIVTNPGSYPTATSYTVTMDLTSIGGSNPATCPMVSTDVYTCHTTVTADVAMVGSSYTIPVTVVDDQTRTLTLTPASIQIGVTAAPEPVATLAWSLASTGSFGSLTQGTTSSAQTAVLTNTGLAALSIASVSGSGDFPATSNCPASLSPNASCTISVTFTPTAVGARTGTLTVTDNSRNVANSQQTLALTGIGMAPPPTATLSVGQLSFGNMIVTTASTAQTVTLSNNGGQALVISALALSGTDKSDFSYTTTCGATLAAGANCAFTVTFKPTTTAGNKTATLSVGDNAAGSPQTVQLSGAGVDFPVGPASGGTTAATVTAGQTATYNMQVSPAGPFNGAVTLACTTIIQGATCTVNPTSVNVNGSAVPFTVSIATAARSVQVAQSNVFPTVMGGQQGPGSSGPRMPLGAICLTALVAMAAFATSKKVQLQLRGAAVCAALLCVIGMTACGGLKTSPWPQQPSIATPAGTYTVTLKATYGAVVRTTTLTLNVQ